MGLVDRLLQADIDKVSELKTTTYESKRLAEILGEKEPVEISLREIPTRKLDRLLNRQYDSKGNVDPKRSLDVKGAIVAESIIDPDLSREELIKMYDVPSTADLAVKLFRMEISDIAEAVCKMSVVNTDEDDVKN